MKRFFENLSMGRKLSLGFGIVLVLTASVAFVGYHGVSLLIAQNQRMHTINQLDNALEDVKNKRLNYFKSHTERDAQFLSQILDTYKSLWDRAQSEFSGHGYNQSMQRLANYRHVFETYRQLIEQSKSITQDSFKLVSRIRQNSEQLLTTLARNHQTNELLALAHLLDRFNKVNMTIQLEAANHQKLSENMANERLEKAIQVAHKLESNGAGAQFKELARLLKAYQTVVHQYVKTLDKTGDLQQKFKESAADMDNVLSNLSEQQRTIQTNISERSQYLLFGFTLVALLIGIFFSWWIHFLTVKPLQKVTLLAQSLSEGHLRELPKEQRKDEIGQLYNDFATLSNNMRQVIGDMVSGITQLSSAVTQLSSFAQQSNEQMTQQHQETDQVATAINEMSATVHEVANNAESTAHTAVETERRVREGNDMVNSAGELISGLADNLNETTQAMAELKNDSDRVGNILDVIKEVADQTNLLALNAAIEAARAGDAGRGFAVVADEVRNLASRTQHSAEEIEALIKQLQTRAEHSLAMMTTSRDQSTDNASQAANVVTVFATIKDSMVQLQEMSQQIATAAEEQSQVSEDINQRIIVVRDLADDTVEGSKESQQALESLSALSSQMHNMSQQFILD